MALKKGGQEVNAAKLAAEYYALKLQSDANVASMREIADGWHDQEGNVIWAGFKSATGKRRVGDYEVIVTAGSVTRLDQEAMAGMLEELGRELPTTTGPQVRLVVKKLEAVKPLGAYYD